MPIEIEENDGFAQTICTGGEVDIDFDFPIFDESHIEVKRTRAGVLTTLVLGVGANQYGVPVGSINDEDGGNIELVTPALAGDIYTLRLNPPIERVTDFQTAGDFFAIVLNEELDLQTQMIQCLRRDLNRAARLADDSTIESVLLPAPVDGRALLWDGTSGLLKNSSASIDILNEYAATLAAISAEIVIVAGIDTEVVTVAGIAADITTVAGIAAAVSTVAGISAAVSTVATNAAAVSTVSTNIANVNTVATNIANVNTMAGIAADGDITAIAGISTTGLAARTASNTWTTRQLTSANLTITNPAGIAGDPAIDVPSTFINSLTGKTTPILADSVAIVDSAASNVNKKATLTALRAAMSGLRTRVSLTAAESIANNTNTAIPWDTADVDELAAWSSGAATRLTVPSGITKVRLAANLGFATNVTGIRRVQLFKNGTTVAGQFYQDVVGNSTSQTVHNVHSAILTVTAGDYFECMVLQSSGGNLDVVDAAEWFEMEVIS